MATSVLAQETYVIDSVCVGAERTYRRDGEAGYTYDWYIRDTLGTNVANPSGIDFSEVITPGDTTWGSEITYQWIDTGIFDIVVEVYTEHGCDTLEQGRVKVYPEPEVEVGEDQTVCALENIIVSGDAARNYSVMFWETSGDGSFSDDEQLHPTYYLGLNDSLAGSVTLTITAWGKADNITCEPAIDAITYFFSNPEIELVVDDLLCFGDSTASVTATVTNGISPYNYSWTGPDGFTASTPDISGLKTGEYILNVIDANGCEDTDTAWINEPTELLISIDSIHDVSCYGYNNGFVNASATGGTPPYQFDLSGFSESGSNVNFNALPAGKYELILTDTNGCVVTDSVEVNEPDELIANIDTINFVQCYGSNDGSAHVSVVGGIGSFNYEWNTLPVQNIAWAVDLEPGTYSVIITDGNGCLAFDTVNITEPDPLVLTADSIDVRCGGKKPGSIDLHVSGGTPFTSEPYYRYEWQDTTGTVFATTEDVENLAGDQLYTVWVTDSLGCIEMHQVYINEIKNVELTAVVDSAKCYGDLWTIDVTATKGKQPYEFVWTDSTGVNVISNDEDMVDVPAGIYIVTVYDRDSCNETMNFVLEEPEELLAELYPDNDTICETEITGIQADPNGGTGVYTHLWTGTGAAFLDRTDTTDVYFGIAQPNDYQLIYTVIDENGCLFEDSLIVTVQSPTYNIEDTTLCEGEPVFAWNSQLIQTNRDSIYRDTLVNRYGCDSLLTMNVTINHGVSSEMAEVACDSFVWSLGNGQTYYTDTIVEYITLGSNGCSDTLKLNLTIYPSEIVSIIIDSDTTEVTEGDTVIFSATVENEGAAPIYAWFVNGVEVFGAHGDRFEYVPENGDTVFATLISDMDCSYPQPARSNVIQIIVNDLPADLTIIPRLLDILCYGDSTGNIELTVSGGSGSYLFSWTGPDGYTSSFQNISELPAGDYTVTVTDVIDNRATETQTVVVHQPDELDLTFTKTDVNGSPDPIGSIELTIQGGTPVYDISWTGPNGFSSRDEDLTGLEVGDYFVTVTDANNCVQILSVQIEGYGMSCPEPVVLECPDSELPVPYVSVTEYENSVGTIASTSSLIESTFTHTDVSDGNTCPEIITRTYSVENEDGDLISCSQTIIRNDVESPTVFIIPDKEYFTCNPDILPYQDLTELQTEGGATWVDNCKIVRMKYLSNYTIESDAICPKVIIRTYEIYDECDRSIRAEERITINDTTPPQITQFPRDINAVCEVPKPYASYSEFGFANGRVSDCNFVDTIIHVGDQPRAGDPYVIERTYRFIDVCGNFVDRIQLIYLPVKPVPVFVYGSFCEGTAPTSLNPVSDNGIRGSWSPDTIDTSVPGFFPYTFTPDSLECAEDTTIIIEIYERNSTSFDSIYPMCINTVPPALPDTSREGISGFWSPDTISTSVFGPSEYIFTPDADECALPYTLKVTIVDDIEPSFVLAERYCQFDSPDVLSTVSNEGFIGVWSPDTLRTDSVGTFTYVFTPDPGQCAVPTLHTVVIEEMLPSTLAPHGPYCQFDIVEALPLVSENGITGSWSPDEIRTDSAGIFTYVFTPDSGVCAYSDSILIEIIPEEVPAFILDTSYCVNSIPDILPSHSMNRIGGIWSPRVIETDSVGVFTYTFTPEPNQCAAVYVLTVHIVEKDIPEFSEFGPYCLNSNVSLPRRSNNGIPGRWLPATVSTAQIGTTPYTFTPIAECATPISVEIEVVDKIIPEFDTILPLCQYSIAP